MPDNPPHEPVAHTIPNPGPRGRRKRKPVFTVLPAGGKAEKAAKLLKEFADKHKAEGDAPNEATLTAKRRDDRVS
jgi:hypothetical protein